MDSSDEKFFESLVDARTDADEEYEVELAKSGVLSSAKPKIMHTKDDELWGDGEPEGQLTVDVYQTPSAIVVESAIAGVKPDDIDINVTTDSITIRGARHREKNVRQEDYIYQECYWGKFARTIILPEEVDPDGAEVTFKNGILSVHLPKTSRRKSKKLRVKIE